MNGKLKNKVMAIFAVAMMIMVACVPMAGVLVSESDAAVVEPTDASDKYVTISGTVYSSNGTDEFTGDIEIQIKGKDIDMKINPTGGVFTNVRVFIGDATPTLTISVNTTSDKIIIGGQEVDNDAKGQTFANVVLGTVTAGQTFSEIDFKAGQVSISGHVYYTGSTIAYEGATVYLKQNGSTVKNIKSDENGVYSFTVPANSGAYSLETTVGATIKEDVPVGTGNITVELKATSANSGETFVNALYRGSLTVGDISGKEASSSITLSTYAGTDSIAPSKVVVSETLTVKDGETAYFEYTLREKVGTTNCDEFKVNVKDNNNYGKEDLYDAPEITYNYSNMYQIILKDPSEGVTLQGYRLSLQFYDDATPKVKVGNAITAETDENGIATFWYGAATPTGAKQYEITATVNGLSAKFEQTSLTAPIIDGTTVSTFAYYSGETAVDTDNYLKVSGTVVANKDVSTETEYAKQLSISVTAPDNSAFGLVNKTVKTNDSGEYAFVVLKDSVVTVTPDAKYTYVGYSSKSMQITADTTLNFTIKAKEWTYNNAIIGPDGKELASATINFGTVSVDDDGDETYTLLGSVSKAEKTKVTIITSALVDKLYVYFTTSGLTFANGSDKTYVELTSNLSVSTVEKQYKVKVVDSIGGAITTGVKSGAFTGYTSSGVQVFDGESIVVTEKSGDWYVFNLNPSLVNVQLTSEVKSLYAIDLSDVTKEGSKFFAQNIVPLKFSSGSNEMIIEAAKDVIQGTIYQSDKKTKLNGFSVQLQNVAYETATGIGNAVNVNLDGTFTIASPVELGSTHVLKFTSFGTDYGYTFGTGNVLPVMNGTEKVTSYYANESEYSVTVKDFDGKAVDAEGLEIYAGDADLTTTPAPTALDTVNKGKVVLNIEEGTQLQLVGLNRSFDKYTVVAGDISSKKLDFTTNNIEYEVQVQDANGKNIAPAKSDVTLVGIDTSTGKETSLKITFNDSVNGVYKGLFEVTKPLVYQDVVARTTLTNYTFEDARVENSKAIIKANEALNVVSFVDAAGKPITLSGANNAVTVYVDGVEQTTKLNINSNSTFNLYADATKTYTFDITKNGVYSFANGSSIKDGAIAAEQEGILVTVTSANGMPLGGKTVKYVEDGVTETASDTDKLGQTTIVAIKSNVTSYTAVDEDGYTFLKSYSVPVITANEFAFTGMTGISTGTVSIECYSKDVYIGDMNNVGSDTIYMFILDGVIGTTSADQVDKIIISASDNEVVITDFTKYRYDLIDTTATVAIASSTHYRIVGAVSGSVNASIGDVLTLDADNVYYKETSTAGLFEEYKFAGWYVNGVKVSDELVYNYTVTESCNIEAKYDASIVNEIPEAYAPAAEKGVDPIVIVLGIAAVVVAILALAYIVLMGRKA